MVERAVGTMTREAKGSVAPPPAIPGVVGEVAQAVTKMPGVIATTHWDLYDPDRVDGIDFYVGEQELGHIHLDGSVHLATGPSLGAELVAKGKAKPLRWNHGWVEARIRTDRDVQPSIALFRYNYDNICA